MAGRLDDDRKPLDKAHPAVKRILAVSSILILGGLLIAYLEVWRHTVPTIRGSTSTEYIPTAAPPRPTEPGVAWPTYGYDQARARAPAGVHLRPPFRKVWTFHGRALLEFPPVTGYGKVYITNFNGRLFALDAATGKTLWKYLSHRCGWASPALSDHLAYETFIGNNECHSDKRDGEIAAFNADTGRVRWLRRIGPTESSPLVTRRTVYVGDWDGRVWALNAQTGRTRWTAQLNGAIKGSLAASGRRLFIGTYGGDIVSLDARTGRILWRSGGHGSIYSSPALAYGRVYVGSLDGGVYALGATTGHLLWARPTGGYVYASPAIWRGRILIGSYDHHFYALDAGTGAVRWSFAGNGPISGSATVVDGLVYFSTFNERTYALAATTGRQVAAWPDGKYSPAVTDSNHLYLVGLGRLYAMATS
jgi:outer membrane protein assembly factor BamB